MNEFIHTFSLITYITESEKSGLSDAYKNSFFFEGKSKKWILSYYADKGIRCELKFNTANSKRYTNNKETYVMEIIVTPSKLIYHGDSMKKLFEKDEIYEACDNFNNIITDIYTKSGVFLKNRMKFARIDITKDIVTPSDEYTMEIIRLAKSSVAEKGYRIWTPTEQDEKNTGWKECDSALYYNHGKNIKAKIYNKLKSLNEPDNSSKNGLLRFEVSLLRKSLIKRGYISDEYCNIQHLPNMLYDILCNATYIMDECMIEPLRKGHFLSKSIQKKYITRYCNGKKKRLDKMLSYRSWLNTSKNQNEKWESRTKTSTVISHFENTDISPIYCKK